MPSRKGLAPLQLVLIIAVLIFVVGYGAQSFDDLFQSSMDKFVYDNRDDNLTDDAGENTTTHEEPPSDPTAGSGS